MKNFTDYIEKQFLLHPSYTAQDAVKQCYQATFGADHLLTDIERAEKYFTEEYDVSTGENLPLFEEISDETVRVNLAAWKESGLDPKWLFRLFVLTAAAAPDEKEKAARETRFRTRLHEAAAFRPDWESFFETYLTDGIRAVHHSESYRLHENPQYRIVRRDLLSCLPVLKKVVRKNNSVRPFTLALDGPASSGKTTLAALLSEVLNAPVIHMDDFFLPPALRTEARFEEPGGNVHYERFIDEVLPKLKSPEAFTYRRFDCSVMELGPYIPVAAADYRIVEGSYSHHPVFGDYADLRIYLTVSSDEQEARILLRNGPEMLKRFRNEWIPMENRYFETFEIEKHADTVL